LIAFAAELARKHRLSVNLEAEQRVQLHRFVSAVQISDEASLPT
jgi:hypothetical protein